MRLLYFSDLHLRVGPRDHLRPELRRSMKWSSCVGEWMLDRFEDRLRYEADQVIDVVDGWLQRQTQEYDLMINGGDNLMPLSRSEDRVDAAGLVWVDQLERWGEDRFIALNGNHELGHGYYPDPQSYSEVLALRKELFTRPINVTGYGVETVDGGQVIAIDSELAFLADLYSSNITITSHAEAMRAMVEEALQKAGPVLVVTHNTSRTRKWLQAEGLWQDLIRDQRKAVLVGGHFHVPRGFWQDGAAIHWCGGASYPEPWLRWFVRAPRSGLRREGPGAVEAVFNRSVGSQEKADRRNGGGTTLSIRHVSYDVPFKKGRLSRMLLKRKTHKNAK